MDHARHNKNACEFLKGSGEYNDWVVTTAYYSAYHYAINTIFPTELYCFKRNKTREFQTFEDYYNSYKDQHKKSRHDCIVQLTGSELGGVKRFIRFLKDECITSRYYNYQVSDDVSEDCISNIKSFSTFCEDRIKEKD